MPIALTTVAATLALVLLYWWVRGATPPMSERAYGIATALYSVCDREDMARLEEVERLVAGDAELSDQERKEINQILALARAEDWSKASGRARALLRNAVKSAGSN